MISNIINTEWLKLKKYKAFWWMTGIVLLTYPGINYFAYQIYLNVMENKKAGSIAKTIIGNPFAWPEAWHTSAFFSSVFIFIPSIIIIMFITNEYTYKTHRQNIIDGWSRTQFMLAKLMDVLLISLLVTVLFFVVTIISGNINGADKIGSMWSDAKYIPLFFLQTFSQLSIAFLIAFFIRKSFIALGIFLFDFLILENILGAFARVKGYDSIGQFLPFEISDRVIPPPTFWGRVNTNYQSLLEQVNPHIIYTIILTAAIWGICFYANSKKDL